MATTTVTTITELCPAIVGEAMLWMTNASLFYPGVGKARQFLQYKDLRNTPGIAATFNRYAAITAGDTTEGDEYVTTSAMDTSDTVTVTASEKQVNVPITDLAKRATTFGADSLIADAGRAIGLAMASKFDSDVFDLFISLGTSKNATNSPVLAAELMETVTALQTNKAPFPYAAFWHPWGWYECLQESNSALLDASKSGPVGEEIWKSFYAGAFLGMEHYVHADIPTATAGADRSGAIISPWAIGAVIASDLKVEVDRRATARKDILVGVMTFGVGVLSASYGYSLLQDVD